MTDQPCPFWPPDPAYDAMIQRGVVWPPHGGWPSVRPLPCDADAMGLINGGWRTPAELGINWPVDSHAARAAHGQRGSGQGQPAASVGAARGFFDAPDGGHLFIDISSSNTAPPSRISINRRQLVKRLRARW